MDRHHTTHTSETDLSTSQKGKDRRYKLVRRAETAMAGHKGHSFHHKTKVFWPHTALALPTFRYSHPKLECNCFFVLRESNRDEVKCDGAEIEAIAIVIKPSSSIIKHETVMVSLEESLFLEAKVELVDG
ncbi:hypothetical protein Nepgr_031059 [Nepenthes gracilis]|uniref:Uncharacterized protein n=1 Tax=Nepenthes gracilis TaxID=150966 RepID=A0AAD3THE1_NEPGR|nr:hypothetical protein Nepgr_031059 [Nepenthes gracilis]